MQNKISTIFFGTHDFAATILQGMIDSGIFDIQLVITQPDQKVGRKQILTPPPVKVLAEKYGLKVEQPEKLQILDLRFKNAKNDLQSEILNLKSEIGICVQYGLIIPQSVLDAPKHGIINVHTSLLPKYRGASPIQTALMNDETETGVTIMKMDAGMDTGPILTQKSLSIDLDDNYITLSDKLAKIAVLGLPDTVLGYVSGKIVPQVQDDTKATYTKILNREDGKIDWSKSAGEIYNQYRGLTPWPGVWTTSDDLGINLEKEKRIKLLRICPTQFQISDFRFQIDSDKLRIKCGNGAIEILELQVEGAKAMDAKSFVNGYLKKK